MQYLQLSYYCAGRVSLAVSNCTAKPCQLRRQETTAATATLSQR